ncbi:hypothetical protein H311_01830 [Anncaliia algerae PRA109]|nr:hypothetical protein H311_01830 [Anncaliia algerae PRA109]
MCYSIQQKTSNLKEKELSVKKSIYDSNRQNLERMNKGRKLYNYKVGQQVLLKNEEIGKLKDLYISPYEIRSILHKGNGFQIVDKKNDIMKEVNIKQIKPFF